MAATTGHENHESERYGSVQYLIEREVTENDAPGPNNLGQEKIGPALRRGVVSWLGAALNQYYAQTGRNARPSRAAARVFAPLSLSLSHSLSARVCGRTPISPGVWPEP